MRETTIPAPAAGVATLRTGVGAAERLERLPMSGFHILILTLACLAWLIEAFDIGLIGVVLPSLSRLWHLTPKETGSLAAITAVGIVLGVVPSGFIADRFDRKRSLMLGMAWYTIVTGFTALAANIASPIALCFIAGIGMGIVITDIESRVESSIGRKLPPVDRDSIRPVAVSHERVPIATIFNRLYLRRTIMCWITLGTTFFIFYAIQLFMPTVVGKMGFALTTAFIFTFTSRSCWRVSAPAGRSCSSRRWRWSAASRWCSSARRPKAECSKTFRRSDETRASARVPFRSRA